MAFDAKFPAAANRHLEAANSLAMGRRQDVAGYLFGLAAECAVKALMARFGIRENAIFYEHFPELRTSLRDKVHGRNAQPLARFILDDRFMNNWEIGMRYSDGKQIRQHWVQAWATQARDVTQLMNAGG